MNTTPDFDAISQTIKLEAQWKLKCLAALRLCFVVAAFYVCLMQLLQVGVFSAPLDRIILLLGLWSGLGLYADGLELVWRRLGVIGRLAAQVLAIATLVGALVSPENAIWFSATMGIAMLLLGAMASGLLHTLVAPLRTARFRQMVKYLRTLPKQERRAVREKLDRNFQTLIAEGFH